MAREFKTRGITQWDDEAQRMASVVYGVGMAVRPRAMLLIDQRAATPAPPPPNARSLKTELPRSHPSCAYLAPNGHVRTLPSGLGFFWCFPC